MSTFEELSTSTLATTLDQTDAILIDVRPIAAYNGWTLKGEQRGGHIAGAKSIPLQWTQYMDWIEVLEEKNITKDQPVIIYGYNADESSQMAEKLHALGFQDLFTYNGFVYEWTAKPELPMERLPRFKHLVYPEWVKQLIDGKKPPHYNGSNYVVCHSHYDHISDYHKGHIPGAIPVDTNSLESTETWNRRSPEELRVTLQNLGIRHDTTVVIYGRFSSPVYDEEKFPGKSAGHLGALRCAAIMLYAGVTDIRILNGGITSWETEGYELSRELHESKPAGDFGIDIPTHPKIHD